MPIRLISKTLPGPLLRVPHATSQRHTPALVDVPALTQIRTLDPLVLRPPAPVDTATAGTAANASEPEDGGGEGESDGQPGGGQHASVE